MDQPSTAVMLSFAPAEQLRLYRLGEATRFRCVRCQRDKTAILVATKGGDWTQTVCSDCHDSLVVAQRETETLERRLAQAKQSPKKAKPQQAKETPLQPTGKRELQLQRQLPGIDRLLAFFRAAGIRVEVQRRGRLLINGIPTRPLAWTVPSRMRADWDNIIDEMALKYAGGKFLKAIEDNARFGEGLRAFLRRREKGFAIMRGDVRLADIRATSARIPHHDVIHGNFLKPGPYWQQVADVVHGAEAELVAEWQQEQEARAAAAAAGAEAEAERRRGAAEAAAEAEAERRRAAARRRIEHLPNDLAPELIDACLDASRRIRLERQVAYERPVVLESSFGELTLLPISETENRLLMPFRLNRRMEALKGQLVLGDRAPLPLLIGEDVADEDAITAWTCALLGFADATCIEFEPAGPTARREPASSRRHLPSSASRHRSSIPTLPRKRWPGHLEPVGHWADYSGAFVAGHRRRLADGKAASAEARDRARRVGIILHRDETWVRPHTRGVPDGIEMRFRWHAPTNTRAPGQSLR
jgi:hypothetical protein